MRNLLLRYTDGMARYVATADEAPLLARTFVRTVVARTSPVAAVAVFTGRRSIAGVQPGKGVALDGVARQDRNRILFLNPAYQLLS